jgi:hypothetical protein
MSSESAATQTSTPPGVVAPISAATVAQCIALLAQVSDLIGPVEPLSATDIRHSLKLRKGGVQVITQMLDLCTHHGVTSVGRVTVPDMSAQLARATALNQIGVQMTALQKKLGDATFTAESSSWQSATALYTMLRRLSRVDPTVALGLQPVVAFFRKKKVAAKKASDGLGEAQKAAVTPSSPPP